MNAARQALLIATKDLRIEFRTRHAISVILVLGVLIVAVLGLGLGPGRGGEGAEAAAILWVAYLFGGMLCFESTMATERCDDAMGGLLAAPVDRGTIFLAKLLTNLALLLTLAVVVTPVGVVLFRFDLSTAPGAFLAIMTISLIGLAALGTLFSAATSGGRSSTGMLAMLVLPLCLPIVLTSTQLMQRAFTDPAGARLTTGVSMLIAFDVVLIVSSWLTFELLLEP